MRDRTDNRSARQLGLLVPSPGMVSGKRAREQRRSAAAKRHHLAPECYLEAWANDRRHVGVILRRTGRRLVTNVDNATVRAKFFTLILPDGTESDQVEKGLAQIEGDTVGVLRRVRAGEWPISVKDRAVLSTLIAMQIGRSPWLRESFIDGINQIAEMADALERDGHKLRVDLRSAGEQTGEVTSAELRASVAQLPVNSLRTASRLAEPIALMRWILVTASDGEFITGDHPVVHWPPEDQPLWMGTGLLTAARTTFPISRRLCLEITGPPSENGFVATGEAEASREAVEWVNYMTAETSHTHIVTHPDSEWMEPPAGNET